MDEKKPRFAAELLPRLLPSLSAVLEGESGLRWAYLFGSAARGQAFSDLDVAVMPAANAFTSLTDAGRLGAELSSRLGIEGLAVDVVELRSCSLPFLGTMLDEAVVVLDREPVSRRFWEVAETLRWLDFKPVWEMNDRLRRQHLREGTW